MITGPQCAAARALVEVGRRKLGKRSGIAESVIAQFERKSAQPSIEELQQLIAALEELGVVFVKEDDLGAGVRLKHTRSDAKQIIRMEGEGGIVASDRVP